MTRSWLFAALLTFGCGGTLVHQPAPRGGFDPQPPHEITDEDVRTAFDARPQMRAPMRVAYYTLDPERAPEIDAMLRSLDGVEATYRIPALLVTGARRFQEEGPPAREVNLRQLRLLAARASCDLLVVFDEGYRVIQRPNGLAALNVLLVPVLFVPFLDAEVHSYLDAYVVDTRNGYLYGQLQSERQGAAPMQTIWSDAERRIPAEHWRAMLEDTTEALTRLIRASSDDTAVPCCPLPP